MVYGETGRFPIYVNVYSRMIFYWAELSTGCENKIVNVLYTFLYIQYLNDTVKSFWFECIHIILNICGFFSKHMASTRNMDKNML